MRTAHCEVAARSANALNLLCYRNQCDSPGCVNMLHMRPLPHECSDIKARSHAHSRPTLPDRALYIELTMPLWHTVVGIHLDRCEKRLRDQNSQPVQSVRALGSQMQQNPVFTYLAQTIGGGEDAERCDGSHSMCILSHIVPVQHGQRGKILALT
jgi:hypothetical protein